MFNVIRIPTKFSRPIKRLSDKEKLKLLDALINVWDWIIVQQTDDTVWDLLSLIYWEWMNMESKNGHKKDTEYVITTTPSDPPSMSDCRVEESRIEYNRIEENTIVWEQALVVEHWSEHINLMQWYLRQAVWLTAFKDSKERWYVTHCYNLMKKIGKEEFNFRLQAILSDQFKAKNCNKLAYLYWELKSFIHSPVIKTKERESALDITL